MNYVGIIAGLVRHGITALGGAGALEGVSTNDPITTTVSVLALVGGLVWSAIKNRKKSS